MKQANSHNVYNFNNFQFFNMGKMLYEGQRGYSDLRVWSINRNFYLGAQRYGYAEWSGDIAKNSEDCVGTPCCEFIIGLAALRSDA
jgi:alpha-glucosidase (family GH31 glycosyl hydrolase)